MSWDDIVSKLDKDGRRPDNSGSDGGSVDDGESSTSSLEDFTPEEVAMALSELGVQDTSQNARDRLEGVFKNPKQRHGANASTRTIVLPSITTPAASVSAPLSASEVIESPGFDVAKFGKSMTRHDKLAHLLAMKKRTDQYLKDVLKQEIEAEKKRQVEYKLETNPDVRAWMRTKFERQRRKARKRVQLITHENEMGIDARMAKMEILS